LLKLAILVATCGCDRLSSPQISTSNIPCPNRNYDPQVDYFPQKVKVTHARSFSVEYHRHYKVVSVKNPWRDADTTFQYVLVQCGTPIPPGFNGAQIVRIPVNSVVSLSTTHLPLLDKLNLIDRLVGVSDIGQVNTPSVISRSRANKLVEVAKNNNTNVEKVLEIRPELVTTYGVGNPQQDSHPQIIAAGVPVAIIAEYMESSPLGRAEWLKFMALFFNREAEAEKVFTATEKRYNAIAKIARQATSKPTVISGFDNRGIWYLPGGESYAAKFIADAGGNYLWTDDRSIGSLTLSFEEIFDRSRSADYWINGSQAWQRLEDLTASDRRYAKFKAVQTGKVFNPDARLNASGGNDFWEGGTANPDVVLADLVKIFHPQLLPKHQLVYYRHLGAIDR
jgi:iron complex transport system substrate-binding protein